MKRIFIALIISSTVFAGCRSKLTVKEFNKINDIKPKPGLSANTQKALELENLYNSYGKETFEKVLFEFLESTDYKNVEDYGWYSSFFMYDDYNSIIDEDLGLKLLEKGLVDINNRLELASSEEQTLYLNMARCRVLWLSGFYYFDRNDLEKGGYFFDLANKNPDCEGNFPARSEEETEILLEKYAQYKKNND